MRYQDINVSKVNEIRRNKYGLYENSICSKLYSISRQFFAPNLRLNIAMIFNAPMTP